MSAGELPEPDWQPQPPLTMPGRVVEPPSTPGVEPSGWGVTPESVVGVEPSGSTTWPSDCGTEPSGQVSTQAPHSQLEPHC